jgi:starch phosphorylase
MPQAQDVVTFLNLDTQGFEFDAHDVNEAFFYGVPQAVVRRAEEHLVDPSIKSVAYFSMEFGLAPSVYQPYRTKAPLASRNRKRAFEIFSNMRQMDYYHAVHTDTVVDIPIYSGGLGVLAGDTLKSAADLKLPLLGVGILWNKGYFDQQFCIHYGQLPGEFDWDPRTYPGLVKLKTEMELQIGSDPVKFNIWKYYVPSFDKEHVIPLVLMDSNHPANPDWARELTDQLYESSTVWWKIVQRKILGVGGMRAIRALGYAIDVFHLNEGHAAFAFVEMAKGKTPEEITALTERFAYTCHTPVEAGHDRLPIEELAKVLSAEELDIARRFGQDERPGRVNLTMLAMNASQHVNAVAKKHEEVTKIQFPSHEEKIRGITNGIHIPTWISRPFEQLFNEYPSVFENWQDSPDSLQHVVQLRHDRTFREKLWGAHKQNKARLTEMLKPWDLRDDVFTIAWARRAAPYKRPSLILQCPDRLVDLAKGHGGLQILFAGKAHPNDYAGTGNIKEILNIIDSLGEHRHYLKAIFLENYDTFVAKLLISGVDVWLNNPLPPFEASGTSGMKAVLNGVLQLSTMDGWVVEAADNEIGEIFGHRPAQGEIGREMDLKLGEDSKSLCDKLEQMVQDYCQVEHGSAEDRHASKWIDRMIHCIEVASFFNTSRMVAQYNRTIWRMTPVRHEDFS